MWNLASLRRTGARLFLPASLAALFAVLPAASRADIAPESALLLHVQAEPAPDPMTRCDTGVVECHQIVRSTTQQGEVVFFVFFMRGAYSWPGETLCLQSIHTRLRWPTSWQLIDAEPCGGGSGGINPGTGALDLSWEYSYPYRIADTPLHVVPVVRLRMLVGGEGRLDFPSYYGQVVLRHGCYGSTFETLPVQVLAEAGMGCGHAGASTCGYRPDACDPTFATQEVALAADPGTIVEADVPFSVPMVYGYCAYAVEPHAPWCAATAAIDEYGRGNLHVQADATGLAPGEYGTTLEVSIAAYRLIRCLAVTFEVQDRPTAVGTAGWGRVKVLYR